MKNERQKRQVRWTLRLVLSSAIVMACILGLVDSADEAAFAAGSGALRGMSWVTVNDTVMGGRSSAALTWNEANHLVWNGNLSLENNGGFVSIRSRDTGSDWSAFDGVEVVLAAAGRDVQVTAQRGDMVVRAGGYRAMVPTQVTGDTKVFIPFSAFVLKRFGRLIQGPALQDGLKNIGQWGLLIADKRPGPFTLTLKSIKPARHSKTTRMSSKVRPALTAAIEQGVPVFNQGDAKGCAAMYSQTLRALVDKDQLGQGTWASQLTRSALAQATKEGPTEAAWTLRRAMDALLRSVSD
jgi:NADH dehydrogenase [ubiquinone] 1 alpha subcomplex assembly factor 1